MARRRVAPDPRVTQTAGARPVVPRTRADARPSVSRTTGRDGAGPSRRLTGNPDILGAAGRAARRLPAGCWPCSHACFILFSAMARNQDAIARTFAAGREALAGGSWERARDHLLAVVTERESAEAWEALGWAGWWLADEELTFRARTRAYRLFRASSTPPGRAEWRRGLPPIIASSAASRRSDADGWSARIARSVAGVGRPRLARADRRRLRAQRGARPGCRDPPRRRGDAARSAAPRARPRSRRARAGGARTRLRRRCRERDAAARRVLGAGQRGGDAAAARRAGRSLRAVGV